MSRKLRDLAGQKFGRLTAIERHGTSLPVVWKCICECGIRKNVASRHLVSRNTVSCGCYATEVRRSANSHGQSHSNRGGPTPTYMTWEGMKQRCHNPNFHHFADYGGRGITVCDEWKGSFETFLEDMGPRIGTLTLERIDNNKGYSKENCRWATKKEQSRNRRDNRVVTYNGKTQIMTEWAREYGLSRGVLWHRLYNMKWDIKDALERPAMKKPRKK